MWFKRVPRAWGVIFVWEVIVSTWCFCCCSERQHCRVSSAYQLVSCPSWGFGLHHSQSQLVFLISHTMQPWERHLSASDLLSIKSHYLATHHVAMVCLGYMFTTFLKIIVNICWIWYPDLNIRKIEVLQSTVPVTWFHYLKNKAKHALWGPSGWAGVFVTSCGLKVSTVVYVALLSDFFGILVFP